MTKEQALGLLSQVWQNDSFRQYLKSREDYLIRQCAENVLSGKLKRADHFSGQIFEIRELATRLRVAYNIMEKKRLEKRDAIKKANK